MKDQLKCYHTPKEHMMMEEAKATSELEGARTEKSACELLGVAEEDFKKTQKREDNINESMKDVFGLPSGIFWSDLNNIWGEEKNISRKYWISHPIQHGDYWLIKYSVDGGDEKWTQGRNEYEAFEMAADAIATCLDVRASWYRRLIFKIFRV